MQRTIFFQVVKSEETEKQRKFHKKHYFKKNLENDNWKIRKIKYIRR